jgi:hypothetical protein
MRPADGPAPEAVPLVPGRLGHEIQTRPHIANSVVYALVVALLGLEQRRTGGKVRPPMRRRTLA